MKQAASLKDFTPDTLLPGVKINTSRHRLRSDRASFRCMRFKGEKWDLFGDDHQRRRRLAVAMCLNVQ